MTKVFNTGAGTQFKVVNMGGGTFGTAYLRTPEESMEFPDFAYGSWGDTHDFISYNEDQRQIATWDDNGGPTDKILLLYIKTSTADLRIFRNYATLNGVSGVLMAATYEVYYNGNTTVYSPEVNSTVRELVYNLGTNSNLTLKIYNSLSADYVGGTSIVWDPIPNLEKIGGGIGAVLNTVAHNSDGSGPPTYWHGGFGQGVQGYDYLMGITKADLAAAASSSPGNQSWDKTTYTWNSSSQLFSLARHSPAAIATSRLVFDCTIDSSTNIVTLTEFNGKNISLYKGLQFENDGVPICFSFTNAGGISTTTTFFTKDVTKSPIRFKLKTSLADGAAAVDITSNGIGTFQVRNCSRIDCDWCDNNETTKELVTDFDPTDCPLPPNFPSPTTNVNNQGVELFNITP